MNDTYTLLDFGDGKRLEQWGPYRLSRPDPTAAGTPMRPELWGDADATYEGEKGKGEWRLTKELPPSWPVRFDDLTLTVKLAPYKHTGVFPEQSENWHWARTVRPEWSLSVLHLFAYTGGMTMALAKDGHMVTHVDSAKPAIAWAKENAERNAIAADGVRWILDDAAEFAAKELRRGKRYDAIVLDPPAFGHSPSGKIWKADRDLAPLLETCVQLLSEKPAFLILNGYAQHDTPDSFHRLLTGILHTKSIRTNFTVEASELFLQSEDGRRLSTGIVGRVFW